MSERVNYWLVALISVPVLLMVILDTTVVDVIIPHIMAALSVDYYDVQWVVIAYMVSAAVVMPAFDWLSSRFSYRTLFIAGTLLFVMASAWCGRATTFYEMVFSRVIQGAGEGIVVPTVTSMVFIAFPPEKRGLAIGLVGVGATMGPALGPTLGGYITEHISWRWAFFINVPIGILLAVAAFFFLPAFGIGKRRSSFDFWGFLFCALFLSSFLIAVSKGQEKQWFSSDFILYLFMISFISLIIFVWIELRSSHPFVQLKVFLYRGFSVSMLVRLVFGASIYGSFFLVPIYCERLRMYPTFVTGLIMLPGALTNGLGTLVSGRLVDRFDPRKILLAGLLLMAYGLHRVSAFDLYTPKERIAFELIFFFLFIGATFTPLNYISMASVPGHYTDVASSMIHVIRFIAGSIGTAVATNRFEYMAGLHFTRMGERINYSNPVLGHSFKRLLYYLFRKAQSISQLKLKAFAILKQLISLKAYVYAFQDCMNLFVIACLTAACLVFLLPTINLTVGRRDEG